MAGVWDFNLNLHAPASSQIYGKQQLGALILIKILIFFRLNFKGTIYLMAQGTLEKVCFFVFLTIYKKIVNK